MNSNSIISDLNPFTNRTLTNRENNNINYNNLINQSNIGDNLNGYINTALFDGRNLKEKTLSTKNVNLTKNNISFNLNNNTNTLNNINSFRSNKNYSISLNYNKEIIQNKLSNLNNKNAQNNQLVKLKNDNSTNINLSGNKEVLESKDYKNNKQAVRKESVENPKSSNCKDKSNPIYENKAKTGQTEKVLNENIKNNNFNIINNNNINNNFCINLDQNFYHVNNYQNLLNNSGNKPEDTKQIPYDLLQEIFENLLKEERETISQFGYLKKQLKLNENIRAILIDWIIEVHYKFKLLTETLFLTINLIDRFLSGKSDILKEKLQLVGIAAMLIACKYEEIYSPELRDFVYISDKSYESEDILKMESEMLKILQFEIFFPSVNRFYEIICIIFNFSEKEIVLGKYLTEIFLIDYRYTKYSSSLIACAVCYLIKKDERKEKLKDLLNLSQSEISVFKECVKDICFIIEHIDRSELIAIKKKYASKENYKFAKLKMLDLL
jgi:cyclin B